jgi:site-specific recombinase XerD
MTGMRETALTEINLSDLDFFKGTIKVIDKRHKTHIYKMNETIREALVNWIEDREIKLSDQQTDALFISNQRKRISAGTIVSIVEKYSLEGLGYKISPHKLRAAFCTILYNRTGDIEFVRRAVGHSCIETTQRYIVDDDTAKDEAASIMSKIFG